MVLMVAIAPGTRSWTSLKRSSPLGAKHFCDEVDPDRPLWFVHRAADRIFTCRSCAPFSRPEFCGADARCGKRLMS